MLRIECLHEHSPRRISPPGSARRLGQKLERALRRSKIGKSESYIRGDDSDQRHARKIVPLGDHLRANQDVDLAFAKIGKDFPKLACPPRHVAVHAADARAREELGKLLLQFFRSFADVMKVLAAAGRARGRDAARVPAIMANQLVLPPVVGQRDRAIPAALGLAAAPADQEPGITAAVEQDQRLRAGAELHLDFFLEAAGNRDLGMRLTKLIPHVHDLDAGERPAPDALLEETPGVFPLPRIPCGLERGRGRPEDGQGLGQARPHHRNVPPVIAGRFLLLVARVVLLIDNHHSKIGKRRKNG